MERRRLGGSRLGVNAWMKPPCTRSHETAAGYVRGKLKSGSNLALGIALKPKL